MEQMILPFPLLIGGIFAGLYLISHRRLLNRLKKDYPEKWKQLGEPEFSDDSDAGSDPLIVDKYLPGHQFPEKPDVV